MCEDEDEYDYVLDRLYDFGDKGKLLWVNVMFNKTSQESPNLGHNLTVKGGRDG